MRYRLLVAGPLLLMIGILCLFAALASSAAYGAPKRGDTPRCQEACLVEHQRQLEKLIKDFEEKRNKIEFQSSLEDSVAKYSQCVENCREPQPVK